MITAIKANGEYGLFRNSLIVSTNNYLTNHI